MVNEAALNAISGEFNIKAEVSEIDDGDRMKN